MVKFQHEKGKLLTGGIGKGSGRGVLSEDQVVMVCLLQLAFTVICVDCVHRWLVNLYDKGLSWFEMCRTFEIV